MEQPERPQANIVPAIDFLALAQEVKGICTNREYTIRLMTAIIAVLHKHGLNQTRENFLAVKAAFRELELSP